MSNNYPFTFTPAGIPDELKQHPSWCVWRGYNGRKIPRCVNDRHNAKLCDPSTLATFDQAVAAFNRPLFMPFSGLAIFLSKQDEYFCLDLDSCVDDITVSKWAQDIFRSIPSYVEISPSGTGLKIIAKGPVPDWINCRKSYRLPQFVPAWTTKASECLVIREGMVTLTGAAPGERVRPIIRTEKLPEMCTQWEQQLKPSPWTSTPPTSATILPPETATSAVYRLKKCKMPTETGDGSKLLFSLIYFMVEKWKFVDADIHAVLYAYHLESPLKMLDSAKDKRAVVQTRIAQVRQRSGITERHDLKQTPIEPAIAFLNPMW